MSQPVYDFDYFPTLTTERLILRELRLEDAAAVFESWSDPEVQKFNAPVMEKVEEAVELIQSLHKRSAEKRGIIWGITHKDRDWVMGMSGYNSWDRYHRRADIGYDLARAHWGQGYASEAVHAMLRFGFEAMNLNRIEAETIEDNHGSVKMLKRLGFTLEGIRRSYSWEDDGTFHNGSIWGLLHHEFPV